YLLTHAQGGTVEGSSLALILDELDRVPRDTKIIMFSLTDGETNDKPTARKLSEQLIERGVILVDIGIGYKPVDRGAHEVIKVDDPSDLLGILPRTLGGLIRKGL